LGEIIVLKFLDPLRVWSTPVSYLRENGITDDSRAKNKDAERLTEEHW
jgi:hypothetical protein